MKIDDTIDLKFAIEWAEELAWEATRAVAEDLRQETEIQAPVDKGELETSVIVQEDRAANLFRVTVSAPHAIYVEFGFIHWITKKFIPPNPFFRRAIEDVRERFANINISAIRSRIPTNKGT